jgi:hypothetical protein
MNRTTLAQVLVIIVILSAFLPILPCNPKNRLGLGGFLRAWELNRKLAAHPFGSAESRTFTRLRGKLITERVRQFMDSIEKVLGQAREQGNPETVRVQVRGIMRNEAWLLAYDLYPVRVIGRFREEGGLSRDPVLPEADWTLTQRRGYVELERVP